MLPRKETNYTPEIGYLVFRKCTPSWFMYEQVVEGWSITYLTAGSASFTINGKELEARAGDLLCLSPGTIRIGATYEGSLMECFAADFVLKRVPGESASLPLPTLSRIGIRKDIIRDFQELNFAWIERQPGYAVRVRGLFLLILHRMLELTVLEGPSADPDPRVERMIRYVASHYPEKLTLQSMASELGMNAVYLGTLFKGRMGVSFNQYLTRARVKNAENMLRSGEYAVSEVAETCGFSDQFHFDKRFKEIMGFPPSSCIPKK
jgi:transcriptional regulator GlxA family with amidase domain